MTVAAADPKWERFTLDEWFRLEDIATKYTPKMRAAYNRAIVSGRTVNKLQIRNIITDIFIDTAFASADTYSLVFNPNSPIYASTIDELTDLYASFADSSKARDAVRAILPMNELSLGEIRERLSATFGLDTRSALMVERYRQGRGKGKTAERDVERARKAAIIERGNRMAITEVNRAINAALESLWRDNMGITKVEYTTEYFRNLPPDATKVWVTRRDNIVDRVCRILEGTETLVGDLYDTPFGVFLYPPIHPFCRCRLVLRF